MKRIERYNEFSKAEQELIHILDQIDEIGINEGLIGDWFKNLTDWFERVNDGIRNLMLTMLEKGMNALDSFKKFFKVVIDKVVTFKEKNPVVFRTIMITLILLVHLFSLLGVVLVAFLFHVFYLISMIVQPVLWILYRK